MVTKAMRYATDSVLESADCQICGQTVIAVDGEIRDGKPRGGQWVHIELPLSIHPATPGKDRISC